MNANEQLITRFYEAFQRKDGAAMAACYHSEVQFSDPVFTDLRGANAGAMWKMLTGRAKDLRIEFRDVQANDKSGAAHWEAWYTFSTGKKVHNIIEAHFEFRDGLIVKHKDTFDLQAWARQALGLVGRILGGTDMIQNKIRATAAGGLREYLAKNPA